MVAKGGLVLREKEREPFFLIWFSFERKRERELFFFNILLFLLVKSRSHLLNVTLIYANYAVCQFLDHYFLKILTHVSILYK